MYSARIALAILLNLISTLALSQNAEMLIEQIAQKEIVREYYDQDGVLQNKQIFLTGELKQENGIFQIDVITELYDESGQLTEVYNTTYQCDPNEFNVLLNVFPFANPDKEKIKVDVTSQDFQRLYNLNQGEELEDIQLTMSIESGVLRLFGSKTIISIENRKREVLNDSMAIRSEAVLKAYMMGIRIKTMRYVVEEFLSKDLQLQRQQFTEIDGDWFTMEYEQNRVN